MSLIDQISGKIKRIFGETTKDPQLRREGAAQERKGEEKEELYETELEAERKAEKVDDLERRT